MNAAHSKLNAPKAHSPCTIPTSPASNRPKTTTVKVSAIRAAESMRGPESERAMGGTEMERGALGLSFGGFPVSIEQSVGVETWVRGLEHKARGTEGEEGEEAEEAS